MPRSNLAQKSASSGRCRSQDANQLRPKDQRTLGVLNRDQNAHVNISFQEQIDILVRFREDMYTSITMFSATSLEIMSSRVHSTFGGHRVAHTQDLGSSHSNSHPATITDKPGAATYEEVSGEFLCSPQSLV